MTKHYAGIEGEIRALLLAAEGQGLRRGQFMLQLSGLLDATPLTRNQREFLLDFGAREARSSRRLAPDAVSSERHMAAAHALNDVGKQIREKSWRSVVMEQWPAPIAHEFYRLEADCLSVDPALNSYMSPEAILLQAKDAGEVLIKFSTCCLLQGIVAQGGEAAEWARAVSRKRNVGLGAWTQHLEEGCRRLPPEAPAWLHALGRAWTKNALNAAKVFVARRNELIGHGARTLDPLETAQELKNMVHGRDGLAVCVDELVRNEAFADTRLFAEGEDKSFPLDGYSSTTSWLEAPDHHPKHPTKLLPLFIGSTDAEPLCLSPLVAARACAKCGHRDVLIFDSLNNHHRGGTFDLLDYARGHKSRVKGGAHPDLGALLDQVDDPAVVFDDEETTNNQRVLDLLEGARLARHYLSPSYLRDPFADFLSSRPSGVFWLQAPAHVGKTTFATGLADPEVDPAPITDRFNRGLVKDRTVFEFGRIVLYMCRKEYRSSLEGFLSSLETKLQEAYDVGDHLRGSGPDKASIVTEPDPHRFAKWLDEWRFFAASLGLAKKDAPLLIIIDGLDEADPPTDDPKASLISILPRQEILPEHVYLLLTSRPVGDPDAPSFLKTHVEPLYMLDLG